MDYTRNPHAQAELDVLARTFISLVGDDVLARMQHTVPKDTWSLHDSFIKEASAVIDHEIFVLVGVDSTYTSPVGKHPADYVTFVEKGTSRMAAQPFIVPSLLQTIGNIQRIKGL
jgi:hypothetical protein